MLNKSFWGTFNKTIAVFKQPSFSEQAFMYEYVYKICRSGNYQSTEEAQEKRTACVKRLYHEFVATIPVTSIKGRPSWMLKKINNAFNYAIVLNSTEWSAERSKTTSSIISFEKTVDGLCETHFLMASILPKELSLFITRMALCQNTILPKNIVGLFL